MLNNGKEVTLRSIRPEDERMEEALFYRLSKETIYRRFFSYYAKPNHRVLSRLTNIDYDREIAIVAELSEKGVKKLIGVVRMIIDVMSNQAEYAIVVADEWQGQGLGYQLTEYILEIAKKRGIATVVGEVLAENSPMIKLLDEFGFKETGTEHGVLKMEFNSASVSPVS